MKRIFLLLLALTGLAACSSVEERVVTGLFRDYMEAQQALAVDNDVKAKAAFKLIADETDGHLKEIALDAASAEDLRAVRAAFKELSDHLVEGELPDGFVVAFCPMADDGKGASWIQPDGAISNPYLGRSMPTCGEVKRKAGEKPTVAGSHEEE